MNHHVRILNACITISLLLALLHFLLDLVLHLLGLQLLHRQQTHAKLILSGEGLGHQPQPLPADLNTLLCAQVGHAVLL